MSRAGEARARPVAALVAALALGAAAANALPDVNTPIDPTRRASVSTSDAVRPSASPFRGDGVIPQGRVAAETVTVRRVVLEGDGRRIDPTAKAQPVILRPEAGERRVRSGDRVRAADSLPAAIPRLDRDQYRRRIAAYARGATPAAELVRSDIALGATRVDMEDINRHAGPRNALERQGIPVARPGSEEASPPTATPVPFPTP